MLDIFTSDKESGPSVINRMIAMASNWIPDATRLVNVHINIYTLLYVY